MRATIILLFIALLPATAWADDSAERLEAQQAHGRVLDVLSIYRDLNDMCRGFGGEDPRAVRACNIREKVARLLNGMGWCYGNQNQNAADLQWHKCADHELF
ncbi:MAG TPA: hypothetical protein VGG12_08345 [Methylovirgula sp.]|jgi:hypothetical protein